MKNDMLIGAFYYPWYHNDPLDVHHWNEGGYMGIPTLGEYSSRDSDIIRKHINWASNYNIDFFIMSWWGYEAGNNFEDITIKEYFLKSEDISNIKFAILYETEKRLKKDNNNKFNFNNEFNMERLIEDIKYICNNYFEHKQYLKIDNKPVVFIYLARDFIGDYNITMKELRAEIRKKGFEMYLIGDIVFWQNPNSQKELIKQFDGITAYNMHTNCSSIDEKFVEKVIQIYKYWFNVTSNLDVDFIPNVMPGFNDTEYRPEKKHPVIKRDINRFKYLCEKSRDYLSDKKIMTITSWNEWHEYTQIEPDQDYFEEYLEVIKQTLVNNK